MGHVCLSWENMSDSDTFYELCWQLRLTPEEKLNFARFQQASEEDKLRFYRKLQKEEKKKMEMPKLTDRQNEVLKLMVQGYSKQSISEILLIGAHTVGVLIASMIKKFSAVIDYKDGERVAQLIEFAKKNIFQNEINIEVKKKEPEIKPNPEIKIYKPKFLGPTEIINLPSKANLIVNPANFNSNNDFDGAILRLKDKYHDQYRDKALGLGLLYLNGTLLQEGSQNLKYDAIKIKEKIALIDEIVEELKVS